MTDRDDPTVLRQRARSLRALATRLGGHPVMQLHLLAGPETWQSPRAELCRHLLISNQLQLQTAIADLHRRADRLDRRAFEIEVAQASAQITIGDGR